MRVLYNDTIIIHVFINISIFLMNYKNYYFVPFGMDDCVHKTKSMVCDFSLVSDSLKKVLAGEEIQKKIF